MSCGVPGQLTAWVGGRTPRGALGTDAMVGWGEDAWIPPNGWGAGMEKACVLRTARSNHVLEYQAGASVATKALFLSTVLHR